MPDEPEHPVVVLYEHPLLGEGIARCVLAETGVAVTVARARDIDAVRAVLACDPSVVIFELGGTLRGLDLTQFAPHAVLIDVSAAMGRGPATASDTTRLDRILHEVRSRAGHRHPDPSGRGVPPEREPVCVCDGVPTGAATCPTSDRPER